MYTSNDYSYCVDNCPAEGSFFNDDAGGDFGFHCTECNVACEICSGSSNSDCSECAAGYIWGTKTGAETGGTDYTARCVNDCPQGEFYEYITMTLPGGSEQCEDCPDKTNCMTCDN